MTSHFAKTPAPPYYAVIFTSQRNRDDDKGYARAAERMVELAQTMPGFLGAESVRDETGLGITVSYWSDEKAIANWKANSEHVAVRESGNKKWYEHYELRVARVERAYDGPQGK
ncbi:MAG TPA: antibiotic biosynthesis monooxygenase [Rhizobiales bacterium]|nr:antibiotic biosynthesis monooxygenase [Hyphomicrobiales bacterium]